MRWNKIRRSLRHGMSSLGIGMRIKSGWMLIDHLYTILVVRSISNLLGMFADAFAL
jgi:hypothetical protein